MRRVPLRAQPHTNGLVYANRREQHEQQTAVAVRLADRAQHGQRMRGPRAAKSRRNRLRTTCHWTTACDRPSSSAVGAPTATYAPEAQWGGRGGADERWPHDGAALRRPLGRDPFRDERPSTVVLLREGQFRPSGFKVRQYCQYHRATSGTVTVGHFFVDRNIVIAAALRPLQAHA